MVIPRSPQAMLLIAGTGLALLADPAPGLAQRKPEGSPPPLELKSQWEIGRLKAGWCVTFLAEAKRLTFPGKSRGAAAAEVSDLPPAVQRVIAEDPRYASWVPARLCALYPEAVLVDGRRHDDPGGGKDKAFGIAWLEAASVDSSGEFGYALQFLATSNQKLADEAGEVGARVERMDMFAGKVQESVDDRYQLKRGRSLVTLDGHPVPDSSLTVSEWHRTWITGGARGVRWEVSIVVQPDSAFGFPGGFRVPKQGAFGRLLLASPIHLVGSLISGGHGQVTFSK